MVQVAVASSLEYYVLQRVYANATTSSKTNPTPVRQQVVLTAPIYKKRAETVAKIENFWPLTIEACPTDIDQFIQPSDSQILTSLKNLDVSNFEIVDGKIIPGGDVRSIAITMEFGENDFFTDSKLVKKLWYRRHLDGWSGLVSEPVKINWKAGKDLTEGLLDLACALWVAEQSGSGIEEAQQALEVKLGETAQPNSFFAFFGFIGRRISHEMSVQSKANEAAERAGQDVEDYEHTEEAMQIEDRQAELEIFPEGDELAISIGEDLWPSAIKYFSETPHAHGGGCNDGCCASGGEDEEWEDDEEEA